MTKTSEKHLPICPITYLFLAAAHLFFNFFFILTAVHAAGSYSFQQNVRFVGVFCAQEASNEALRVKREV